MTSDSEPAGERRSTRSVLLRAAAPSILLIAFLLFALLYRVAPPIYLALLRGWGEPAWNFPFLDLHAIISALECKRQGFDVMRLNPCDILGRPHVYSPLWLAPASLLPVTNAWLLPAGLALDLLFIVSLYRLPPPARLSGASIMAIAALSPATAYALERANNDLIIFLLIVALTPFAIAAWPRRVGSYAVMVLAGLLKYYPLALLILMLRETPKRFFALLVAMLLVVAGFYLAYRPELMENAAVIDAFRTSYYTDSFDFRNLPYGIVELIPQFSALTERFGPGPHIVTYIVMAILLFDLAGRARRVSHDRELGANVAALSSGQAVLLVIGATLITGCFFAGHTVLYRGIFFLLVIPGLLVLERAATQQFARSWLRQGLGLIPFLMWSEFFRQTIDIGVTFLPAGRITNGIPVVFWAFKELMWWRVIGLFCGLLVGFFAEAPSAHFILRRLPWIRIASTR
jgi:hypothetical protein